MKRILILGGGFAAIAAAQRLEKRLRRDEAELVLISRENFSLFTPMLPEVSSGALDVRHIVTPIRSQLRRTRFILYTTLGLMASLGARKAVAQLPGEFVLTGFPAWFLWRTYYLSRLPGLDRKLRVAFDWTRSPALLRTPG